MKLKWLKNLEEKKKHLCTHIYKKVEGIIYKLDWPFEVRLNPTRSVWSDSTWHSLVNPNRLLKTNDHPEGHLCSRSGLSQKNKHIQDSWFKHSFQCFKRVTKKKNKIMATLRTQRGNPLNKSFRWVWWTKFSCLEVKELLSLEAGGRANETVLGCVAWRLRSVMQRAKRRVFNSTSDSETYL